MPCCCTLWCYSRISRFYCRLAPHLKFNHLPWKRIIYEQICSWSGSSCAFTWLSAGMAHQNPWLLLQPMCQNTRKQRKKGRQVCFSKYACNYSNSVDTRIIPPQNTCHHVLWALLVHLLCCLCWAAFSCPPMVEWRWPQVNNEQPGSGGEERCIRLASIPGGSPALISTGSRVYAQSSGQSH